MRRSLSEFEDVVVAVRELPLAPMPRFLPLSLPDLGGYLGRRAGLHAAVLGLALAVLAGSAVAAHAPAQSAPAPLLAAESSLALSAQTSIIARAIPFTQSSDSTPYTVAAGDTLGSIAHRTGVSEEALLAYNGLASADALTIGLQLRIPNLNTVPPDQLQLRDTAPHDSLPVVAAAPAPAAVAPLPAQKPEPVLAEHAVQRGENISAIANQAGITPATLLQVNDLTSRSVLSIGQKLLLPDLNGSVVSTQADDTIQALAAKYSVPAAALLAANKLNPNTTALVAGQPLLVPSQPDVVLALKTAADAAGATAPQASSTAAGAATAQGSSTASSASGAQNGSTAAGAATAQSISGSAGQSGSIAANAVAGQSGSTPAGAAAGQSGSIAASAVAGQSGSTPANAVAGQSGSAAATAAQGGADAGAAQPAAQAATQEAAQPKALPAPKPASAPGFIWPATGVITTYFSSWHNGIDIANSMGTPVHAVQAGTVVFSGWDNTGFGYMVRIDHGNGLQSLYGHASKLLVSVGQTVEQGQLIMLMGSTGRSTGPHVHFGIFQGSSWVAYNPLRYLP